MCIRDRVLFQPETITVNELLAERNAEIRRVMIELMGIGRLLDEGNAKILDSDTDPGGKRQLVQFHILEPHHVRMSFLHCFCPSTGREYLLRVSDAVENCHAAAAWLAGFDDPSEYRPIVET